MTPRSQRILLASLDGWVLSDSGHTLLSADGATRLDLTDPSNSVLAPLPDYLASRDAIGRVTLRNIKSVEESSMWWLNLCNSAGVASGQLIPHKLVFSSPALFAEALLRTKKLWVTPDQFQAKV